MREIAHQSTTIVTPRRVSRPRTLIARRQRYLGDLAAYLLLIMLGGMAVLPLLWMVSTAFKTGNAFFVYPPQLIPAEPTWSNFSRFLDRGGWSYIRNSLIVSVSVTAVVVFTCALAGYALAKIPFPGRRGIFFGMLSGLMIPAEVTLVPLFILVVRLELVDSFLGIILPMCASPFGIFVMRNFLLSVPNELLDAARVDGATEFGIFWRIVMPISKPPLAALSTIVFLSSWSAFLWPLIASSRDETRTLPVAVALFQQPGFTANYGLMMAGATIAFVPALAVYVAFQRYFVQGITMSGFKG